MTEQLFDMMKKLYWRKRWGDDVDHTPIEWRYYPYDDDNDDDDDGDDDDNNDDDNDNDDENSPIKCGYDHVATLPSCHPFPLPLNAAEKN